MNFRLIATLILLLTGSISYSQYTLSGKIASADGPVPMATIVVKQTSIGTSADLNGHFTLENLPKGEHTILVSAIGYVRGSFTLKINEDLQKDFRLETMRTDLNTAVVTGDLKERSIADSPTKIELISSKFLASLPTNDVMESISYVNGIQEVVACGVCGTNEIRINGLEGPYTLLLIDGMPVMSALGTIYGLNGIPNSLIEQIEVIKGPSSTLYGSEALGGVINIRTKSPKDLHLFAADLSSTTQAEHNFNFAFAPKVGKKASTLLSVDLFDNNKFIDENGDNFSDVPLKQKLSVFNKWSFNRKSGKEFSLLGRIYGEERFGGVSEWDESLIGSDAVYGEWIETKRAEFLGKYELPTTKNIYANWSASYHDQKSFYGDTNYDAQQQIYFLNLVHQFDWKKHDMIVGFAQRYQLYTDNTLAAVDDKRYVPEVFAQANVQLTEKHSMLAGLRVSHQNEHGLIAAPRFNWKTKVNDFAQLRFNFGTGFRVVNLVTEDHAALSGSRQIVIKEDLAPERSYNATASYTQVYSFGGQYGTLDADVFYTRFQNKIIPDYDQDPNLIVYQNLEGFGISQGVAINIDHKIKSNISFTLGGTYQNVYSQDDLADELEVITTVRTPQLLAPEFSGNTGLRFSWKQTGIDFDYSALVYGPMELPTYEAPFQRPTRSPWFAQHNLLVKKNFGEHLQIRLGVKNIFDYTQSTPLVDPENPFGDNFDTAYAYGPLQGRRFVAGVKWVFGEK